MNPKARMMSAPNYIKQTHKAVRSQDKRAWKNDQEVARHR